MAELFDQWGRPIRTELLRAPQAAPTFHGIRNIYSITHPSIALTPEKLTAILHQSEWGDPWLALELFQDMEEKDLHYLSVLSTRKQTIAQLELAVTPGTDDAVGKSDADFIRAVLLDDDGLGLQSTFADIEDAVGKGFSCTEIMWGDGSDGSGGLRWLPHRFAWRDPRWFMFDWISGEQVLVRTWRNEQTFDATTAWQEDGWKIEMSGLIERTPEMSRIGIQPATAPLIPYKFITHVAKAKSGIPVRGGLSRAVAWIYLFKNYVIKDWVTYTERYGMPARLGKYGSGATDDDKNVLLRACAQLGSDSASIVPESMTIELIEASKSGSRGGASVFADAAHYFDDAMSKAVLGQTLTTELTGKGGSRAAAQVHDQVRRDILQWDAVRLSETLTRDLVRPLIDLNRGPRSKYPQIVLKIQTGADKMWMDMVGSAADHGVEIGQEAVRDQLGLPAPTPGERLLTPKQTTTPVDVAGSVVSVGSPAHSPPSAPLPPAEAMAREREFLEPPDPAEGGPTGRAARVVVVEGDGVWVVSPESGEYVMLPGGHVEPGETFRQAALREVREETGFDVELTGWLADFVDERSHRRCYVARRVGATPHEHVPSLVQDGDGSGPAAVRLLQLPAAMRALTSEYDRAAVEKLVAESARRAAHAAGRRRRPAARTEDYAARMAGNWRDTVGPWIETVKNYIANADSLPDAQSRLHELVDEMDVSTFERAVRTATFNVRAAADGKVRLP